MGQAAIGDREVQPMGIIIPFPKAKAVPLEGLTEQECDAVQAKAYDLMLQGLATGVSIHNDGQYMCVFDRDGEPYSLGRENGVCYLFDNHEMMLARSQRFEIVLVALEMALLPSRDETGSASRFPLIASDD
jgi:hypothetical protein